MSSPAEEERGEGNGIKEEGERARETREKERKKNHKTILIERRTDAIHYKSIQEGGGM